MNKACCFTGHRNIRPAEMSKIGMKAREVIIGLIGQGVKTFYVGGAMGFDTLVAEILLDLRDKANKDIRIVSVIPFPDWREGWPDSAKLRQDRILQGSDEMFYVTRVHSREAYLRRNREMVDRSGYCIAYCTRASGGTPYTIRYAMRKGLQVINLADWDLTQLSKG